MEIKLIKFLILIIICVKTVHMRHNLNAIGNSAAGRDKINEAKHPFQPLHHNSHNTHHHLRHFNGHNGFHHNRTPYGIVPSQTTIATTTIKPTTSAAARHANNEDIKSNQENQQDNYSKYANDNDNNNDDDDNNNDDDDEDDDFDYEYDDAVTLNAPTTTTTTTSTTTTTTRRPRTTTELPAIKPVKMAYESLRNSNDPNYYHHNTNHQNIIKHYNHKSFYNRGVIMETKSLRTPSSSIAHHRTGDSKLAKRHHNDNHHPYPQHNHHNHHHQHHQSSHEFALQHDEGVRSNEHNSTAEIGNAGELTEQKFAELGTREGVKRDFNRHIPNAEIKILVNQHVEHVKNHGQCGSPKPQVVQVNHDASKEYFPHCTILHVCSNDSGCCDSDAYVCAPKIGSIMEVELHFAVMGIKGTNRRNDKRFETKRFLNHTQCECVLRSASTENYHSPVYFAELTTKRIPPSSPSPPSSVNLIRTRNLAMRRKRCPRYYVKVVVEQDYDEDEDDDENENCDDVICDCTSSNRECKNFKEGFENFSILDRKCIREGSCLVPTCEHGQYDSVRGRCPQS